MNLPASNAHDESLLDKISNDIVMLRWDRALALFQEIKHPNQTAKQLKRLVLNMMMLMERRAILYNQLVICLENGLLDLEYKPPEVSRMQINKEVLAIASWIKADQSIAILGVEDGYTLSAITSMRPVFEDGRTTAFFVIEPNPERLLSVLQVHDWTQGNTPFTNATFEWFLGEDWAFGLRDCLQKNPLLPAPSQIVVHSPQFEVPLRELVKEITLKRNAVASEQHRQLMAKKVQINHHSMAKILVGNAKVLRSPPRVLVVGNRFNMQSIRIAPMIADALTQQGWLGEGFVEPTGHHRLTSPYIQQRVAQSDPNLVISVYQPLAENGVLDPNTPTLHIGNIPSGVTGHEPFVYMAIADPLSLMHLGFGDSGIVAPGIMPAVATNTLEPQKIPQVAIIGDAPRVPTQMLEGSLEKYKNQAQAAALIKSVGQTLLDQYQQGRSLSTLSQLEALIKRRAQDAPVEVSLPTVFDFLWQLNEALFVLRTVQMAIDACEKTKAKLILCGKQWEQHQALIAQHADVVQIQTDSQSVALTSTVCLHAHAGFCLNQKLLNLISSGAFVLVREHPLNQALPALASFWAKHMPNAKTHEEAQARIKKPKDLDTFKTLTQSVSEALSKNAPEAGVLVRSCARSGVLDASMQGVPHLAEIGFKNADSLAEKITYWHTNQNLRQSIVKDQQEALSSRLGVKPTLLRALGLLARRFSVTE